MGYVIQELSLVWDILIHYPIFLILTTSVDVTLAMIWPIFCLNSAPITSILIFLLSSWCSQWSRFHSCIWPMPSFDLIIFWRVSFEECKQGYDFDIAKTTNVIILCFYYWFGKIIYYLVTLCNLLSSYTMQQWHDLEYSSCQCL